MVLVDPFDHSRGFRVGCRGKGDHEDSMELETKFLHKTQMNQRKSRVILGDRRKSV